MAVVAGGWSGSQALLPETFLPNHNTAAATFLENESPQLQEIAKVRPYRRSRDTEESEDEDYRPESGGRRLKRRKVTMQ